jgi:hypothetical protein
MATKETPKYCRDCKHVDKEAYKGMQKWVCFKLTFIEGRWWATEVKHGTEACPKFEAVCEGPVERRAFGH